MPRRSSRHRNVFTHLTAAIVVPGCLVLCWWQVTRALSGNSLSWAYVFEWPIFAGYAVFLWWKLIHEPPADARSNAGHPGSSGEPVVGPRPGGAGDRPEATTSSATPTSDGLHVPDAGQGDEETEEDEELASYNRYLSALNASNKRKHW